MSDKLTALRVSKPFVSPLADDDLFLIGQGNPGSPESRAMTGQELADELRSAFGLDVSNTTCGGRLTILSGDAAPQTDQTAKTTIYFTPYTGNTIALYDGVDWKIHTFSEVSLSLSGFTTGKNNDIFVYDNAGTITLERVEWTSDSARATALVLQDGVLVKSGSTNKRYVGTFRTSATGQCEDSVSKRFVWNYYNRIQRYCQVTGTTGHTNTSATVIQWNNDAAMKFEFVVGVKEDQVFITLLNDYLAAATSSTTQGCVGLGINTISALTATSYWASAFQGRSSNNTVTIPALGYNYVALLERGLTGVTFNVAQTSMLLKG